MEDVMDKYEELIKVFSDILKESQDYHIAHIYHVGYVSVVGEIGVTNCESSATFLWMKSLTRLRKWRIAC